MTTLENLTTCKLCIDAKLESLQVAIDFISEQALLAECTNECLWKIQLAAEEAIVNIIEHGYKKNPGTIQISCSSSMGRDLCNFTLALSDTALAFDPTQLKDSIPSHEHPGNIRGNGIKLMKNMMDEIHYANIENKNVLTLKKTLSSCNS